MRFNELATPKFKITHEKVTDEQERLCITIGQHPPCYIDVNSLPELLNLLETFDRINTTILKCRGD